MQKEIKRHCEKICELERVINHFNLDKEKEIDTPTPKVGDMTMVSGRIDGYLDPKYFTPRNMIGGSARSVLNRNGKTFQFGNEESPGDNLTTIKEEELPQMSTKGRLTARITRNSGLEFEEETKEAF